MGCFNLSGFYSHVPIEYGDRIGAIVCIVSPPSGVDYSSRPIGATGFGYHPIMAPIYGTYDEYGCLENPESCLSLKLFEEILGIDFLKFQEMNYRNGGTSLKTPDNDNRFDNIPEYQKYLRKLIPELEKFGVGEKDPAEVKELNEQMNSFMLFTEENAVIHIIYEHESVLKGLQKIGIGFATEMFAAYEDSVKKCIEDESEMAGLIGDVKDEDRKKKLQELQDKSTRHNLKLALISLLSLGDCCSSDFDLSVLVHSKNYLNLVKDEYKEEVMEIFAISHALSFCGGYFCASKYDGQEPNVDRKLEVQKVILDLLENKNKE